MVSRYVVVVGLSALVSVGPARSLTAQAPEGSKSNDAYQVGKTAWGEPDIQGIWNFGTTTPLERPLTGEFADKSTLTPEEIAKIDEAEANFASVENRKNLSKEQDRDRAYNQEWWDRGSSIGRTSIIIDPPDGRLPEYTQAGKARVARQGGGLGGDRGSNHYLDRTLSERCLVYRPVPVRSSGYNNNNQIVQGPGYVAMLQEQIHETRIIPTDGRPFPSDGIRPWLGVSRGRWEGNTLVVETKNFHPESNYEGAGGNRVVVERFTRTGPDTMSYEFTVTDPTTWVRPFTGEVPWKMDEGPLFEYACHEGNYGMVHLLQQERNLEKAAAAKSSQQQR